MLVKQKLTKTTEKNHGFTIVELLIVIVVIAILAAITIVAYSAIQDKARATIKVDDIKSLQKLIILYYTDNGSYPNTGGSWNFQRAAGNSFIPGITPTYAPQIPSVTDGPTGSSNNNTYIYISNGTDYKLDRLNQSAISTTEWAQVPVSMRDGSWTDRWGVWSSGGAGF